MHWAHTNKADYIAMPIIANLAANIQKFRYHKHVIQCNLQQNIFAGLGAFVCELCLRWSTVKSASHSALKITNGKYHASSSSSRDLWRWNPFRANTHLNVSCAGVCVAHRIASGSISPISEMYLIVYRCSFTSLSTAHSLITTQFDVCLSVGDRTTICAMC